MKLYENYKQKAVLMKQSMERDESGNCIYQYTNSTSFWVCTVPCGVKETEAAGVKVFRKKYTVTADPDIMLCCGDLLKLDDSRIMRIIECGSGRIPKGSEIRFRHYIAESEC